MSVIRNLMLTLTSIAVVTGNQQLIRVVDLTHSINTSTIYWPDNPEFNFTILNRVQTPNYWYESNFFSTAEHGGTHLDSPAHFFKGSWRVHEIPPERLIGPVVVINITQKVSSNPDYRVQIADITKWESDHGQIPAGSIVLMKSGWSARYPNREDYFNTKEITNPSTFHFPSFHEDTAEWLITERDISIVGVDTASVDYGQSKTYPVHQLLGKNNIPGLENVASLEQIPENGATLFVGIIKLYDGSGGPVRLLATFDTESSLAGTIQIFYWIVPLSFLLLVYNISR